MFIDVGQLFRRFRSGRVERSRLLSCIQVVIALVFLIGVAAMSASAVRSARSSAAKHLVARGGIVTSIVSRTAAQALDRAGPDDANAALEKVIYDIRAEEGLEFAFIVGRGRRALAHSDTSLVGKVLDIGLEPAEEAEARQAWGDDGFYYTTRPADPSIDNVSSGGTIHEFVRPVRLSARTKEKYLGDLELHLGFALPGWGSFAGSSAKRIVPGLAVAFLLLIIGNYAAGVLIRPLGTLKRETATAAKATDDWRLDVDARGDIAEIAHNWNDMVGNFRSSYESMVEARRELEVRNRVMLYEKKRTESIVDSLSDGVMVTDSYGKISFINRECENMLGVNREETIGRCPADVMVDESIARFAADVLPPLNGGKPEQGAAAAPRKSHKRVEDVEVERKNGTCHIRITHVLVLDTNGAACGAITTFRNTTQHKLEEQARKDFISSVTHELRAPLTAIKSYVEMLIDNEAKNPELQRDFFNTINEEADRLARLIDDMLNMSKMEVGNLVLNKSLVRMRKMLDDAVNGVRSAAKNKAIDLTANIADDLPDVEADKEMVRVVVTNLLTNGIKYTQEGGRVFLTAELLGRGESQAGERTIVVTVGDNGPGIPEDEQNKVFEKFYRARGAAEQKVVGNGLGLALAREIATLHGGDIKLDSKVGEGSKFSFLLPAAATSRKVS